MKLKKKLKKIFAFARRDGGFTLVELIVVIAILGILAGVGTVGYSGYIKKANLAADEVLLNSLNTAFAAACIENGVNPTEVTANDINLTDKKVDEADIVLTHAKAADIETDFWGYYKGGEFKVMTALDYNIARGCFVGSDGEFRGVFNTLKEKFGDDIENKIKHTNLGAIGTENLFDQMNDAMDMAGNLGLHNLGGANFNAAYFEYLGFDPADYDTDEERQVAFDAKLGALGVDDATAATNAIALYAAQNSNGLTVDSLGKWLGGGMTTDNLQNSASGNTLAEAAAIYGMYLSYYKATNGTTPTNSTLEVMNEALSDSNFANWVKDSSGNAQAELDAYKTYMGMINEAGKDENTRNEILANGFSNPELESLVKELIGN